MAKVYIFGEGADAKAIADAERKQGNTAHIRNPEFFNAPDADYSCDKVVTWDAGIFKAFDAKGVEGEFLGATVTEAEAEAFEPVEKAAKTAKPKSRFRK